MYSFAWKLYFRMKEYSIKCAHTHIHTAIIDSIKSYCRSSGHTCVHHLWWHRDLTINRFVFFFNYSAKYVGMCVEKICRWTPKEKGQRLSILNGGLSVGLQSGSPLDICLLSLWPGHLPNHACLAQKETSTSFYVKWGLQYYSSPRVTVMLPRGEVCN